MTSKRLDRKFMSWIWGIIRLYPFILFVSFLIYYTFVFKGVGFVIEDNSIINNFSYLILNGNDDLFFDFISFDILPTFIKDIMSNISDFFGLSYLGYLSDFLLTFVFYQLWISILQILFNVFMILPNIANWFIEKFNHLGNKGDF